MAIHHKIIGEGFPIVMVHGCSLINSVITPLIKELSKKEPTCFHIGLS